MIVENSQVAESTENINMLQTVAVVLDLLAMKAKPKTPSNINFRPNPTDATFIEAVRENLSARLPGIKIDNNKVLRFALRAAAQVLEQGIEVRAT